MSSQIVQELDHIFKARSIAVIGASNSPAKWGYSLMERPIKSGYQGRIYPVNPNEAEVWGLKAYRSVLDIPDQVDLAVFAIPAALVPKAIEECGRKGIKGAVVISAGFAETGPEGEERQQELVAAARRAGIRFVGPNCNGIWSSAAGLSLSSPNPPRPGPIAFVSQSGAFGGYLVQVAEAKGYGLSKFISSGNQADLTQVEYLEYLSEDPDTKVIVFYIEGLREGRRFLDLAKEVVKRKPVIVYKAGRTNVGARAVMSHTGSLALDDRVFDHICRQFGLIRAYEALHLFDMAEALAVAPLPRGPRVGIVSMTGGQCVVTSDTCAFLGLEVPELDQDTQARLKGFLAPHAPTPRNPVDLAGDFRSPLLFSQVAEVLAPLDYIDLLIISPPGGGAAERGVRKAVEEARRAAESIAAIPKVMGKPVLSIGRRNQMSGPVGQIFRGAGIPSYETPEECARAAYALVQYSRVKRGE